MDYKTFLAKQFDTKRISHAYMIVGKYFDVEALGDYVSGLLGCSREDTLRIEGSNGIAIHEIKVLKRELGFVPFNSDRKVAIITPADNLTVEAQNALLKILEEPAEKSVVLLVVEHEDRILPTVASRCQRIRIIPDPLLINEKIPSSLIEGTMGIRDRFDVAQTLAVDDKVARVLDGWLIELGNLLVNEPNNKHLLGLIPEVNKVQNILRTNANTRLVLENLLLRF
ncbi:MAG: hypothetical protein Q7S37_01465 [bacterium]|nr:hypothetical protein [bacterium]